MKKQLLFFLALFSFVNLAAQTATLEKSDSTDWGALERKVMQLGKTILTDSLQQNRLTADEELRKQLPEMLNQSGSFSYPFDSVQTISIQYPADSSFRIFTWQLYVDIDEYRYAGFIQTNAEKPQVISLKDKSLDMEDVILDFEVMTADNWYGALYYNIMSFDTPEGTRHLLFGYDGYQFFNKRKLIDVLRIENGQPIFGDPVFTPLDPRRTDLIKNRVMMQYAAGSNITLNFNEELEMIVFDNLIPHTDGKGRPSWVPDGSYKGYQLKDGLWVYKDKIFDQVSEKPPMPAPVLDKRKEKDILGRKSN